MLRCCRQCAPVIGPKRIPSLLWTRQSIGQGVGAVAAFGSGHGVGTGGGRLVVVDGAQGCKEHQAKPLARALGVTLVESGAARFADGEVFCRFEESVRGDHVCIVGSLCPPANDSLMETLVLTDAVVRSGCSRVTFVLPYVAYARQDRLSRAHEPLSSQLVLRMLDQARGGVPADLVCVDLHAPHLALALPPSFGLHSLSPAPLIAQALKERLEQQHRELQEEGAGVGGACWKPEDLVFVSPDAGGVKRTRRVADAFRNVLQLAEEPSPARPQEEPAFEVATMSKTRARANVVASMELSGDVAGKHAFIVDDIGDTLGTLFKAAEVLKQHGALTVGASLTHGLFSPPAPERLQQQPGSSSPLDYVWVSNSLTPPSDCGTEDGVPVGVYSLTPLLQEAVERLHLNDSLDSDMCF